MWRNIYNVCHCFDLKCRIKNPLNKLAPLQLASIYHLSRRKSVNVLSLNSTQLLSWRIWDMKAKLPLVYVVRTLYNCCLAENSIPFFVILVQHRYLSYATKFVINRPTLHATAASRLHGLCFLQMIHSQWKPVQVGSICYDRAGSSWCFYVPLRRTSLQTEHRSATSYSYPEFERHCWCRNSSPATPIDENPAMHIQPRSIKGKDHLAADALYGHYLSEATNEPNPTVTINSLGGRHVKLRDS